MFFSSVLFSHSLTFFPSPSPSCSSFSFHLIFITIIARLIFHLLSPFLHSPPALLLHCSFFLLRHQVLPPLNFSLLSFFTFFLLCLRPRIPPTHPGALSLSFTAPPPPCYISSPPLSLSSYASSTVSFLALLRSLLFVTWQLRHSPPLRHYLLFLHVILPISLPSAICLLSATILPLLHQPLTFSHLIFIIFLLVLFFSLRLTHMTPLPPSVLNFPVVIFLLIFIYRFHLHHLLLHILLPPPPIILFRFRHLSPHIVISFITLFTLHLPSSTPPSIRLPATLSPSLPLPSSPPPPSILFLFCHLAPPFPFASSRRTKVRIGLPATINTFSLVLSLFAMPPHFYYSPDLSFILAPLSLSHFSP